MVLTPPLPATMSSRFHDAHPFRPVARRRIVPGTSGIYDFADDGTGELTIEVGEVFQNCDSRPTESEFGAAHGYVEGRRGESADRQAAQ